jgi:hypothetical protein
MFKTPHSVLLIAGICQYSSAQSRSRYYHTSVSDDIPNDKEIIIACHRQPDTGVVMMSGITGKILVQQSITNHSNKKLPVCYRQTTIFCRLLKTGRSSNMKN